MDPRPTVAIIHHEFAWRTPRKHMISLIAPHWEAAGFRVEQVYGAAFFIPADLAILHVDLSVVPEAYRALAARYPRAINLGIVDIRKASYSRNLVAATDDYDGPVIVKTSLNSAGWPESFSDHAHLFDNPLRRFWWKLRRIGCCHLPLRIRSKSDYRIFSSPRLVPREVFDCPELVVERFLPERWPTGEYCLREWFFLGDAGLATCEISRKPIFTSGKYLPARAESPPPEIQAIRRKIGLEYGKIDYAIHGGKPVLFDLNKTTGMSCARRPRTLELARRLSAGIYQYFPEMQAAIAAA